VVLRSNAARATARLTVKELQALQLQLKEQIDYVISDKTLGLGDELLPATPVAGSGAGSKAAASSEGSSGDHPPRRQLPEQLDAPWGLDAIDQSSLPLNGKYDYENMGASWAQRRAEPTLAHVLRLAPGVCSRHARGHLSRPHHHAMLPFVCSECLHCLICKI
jgi:hypothetical protein